MMMLEALCRSIVVVVSAWGGLGCTADESPADFGFLIPASSLNAPWPLGRVCGPAFTKVSTTSHIFGLSCCSDHWFPVRSLLVWKLLNFCLCPMARFDPICVLMSWIALQGFCLSSACVEKLGLVGEEWWWGQPNNGTKERAVVWQFCICSSWRNNTGWNVWITIPVARTCLTRNECS